jgi:phosphatidylserine/phosphatidylglycerophosphate/cardiolipin synthase-like enzyme
MLNFEAGLAIDDPRIAGQLERQFDEDVKDCAEIDPTTWPDRPVWRAMAENTFRMFAPVF